MKLLSFRTFSNNSVIFSAEGFPCCGASVHRSQMTSKCGKNKKVAHEAIAECVTDVLTAF